MTAPRTRHLRLLPGALATGPGTTGTDAIGADATVLHPVASLSRRAGITPVAVPSDMWVDPALAAAMRAPRPARVLRAVA